MAYPVITNYADNYSDPLAEAVAGVQLVRPIKVTMLIGAASVIALAPLPIWPNFVLDGFVLDIPVWDTGSPALTLDVGDVNTQALFVSASTAGQAGGRISSYEGTVGVILGTLPRQYSAAYSATPNSLILSVVNAAGTAATATLIGQMLYHLTGYPFGNP